MIKIAQMRGWTSPRLGVRFELEGMELCLTRPNGRRFVSYVELDQWAESAEQRAEQERQRAESAAQRAEQEKQRLAAVESELARLRALLQQRGIDPAG